jgi:serine/threonine-protein kinase HipA
MSTVKINLYAEEIGFLSWDESTERSVLELNDSFLTRAEKFSPFVLNNNRKTQVFQSYEPILQGLPSFVADSLPDYFGNRIFQEWLNKNSNLSKNLNPVDRLRYIGQRGFGALEYQPTQFSTNIIEKVNVDELAEISRLIIEEKYATSDYLQNPAALASILQIGATVGGAQSKVLLAIHPKTGEIKAGDLLYKDQGFDYHILKLAQKNDANWGVDKTVFDQNYRV